MDKWFAVQAGSRINGTTDQVKKLMQHPTFDIKNPNKTFALLRTFSANHVHFHAADGSGYRLISDAIQEVDDINPQVAARLARSFDRYQKFDQKRQVQARNAMDNIMRKSNLSKDTGEIISKTLAA